MVLSVDGDFLFQGPEHGVFRHGLLLEILDGKFSRSEPDLRGPPQRAVGRPVEEVVEPGRQRVLFLREHDQVVRHPGDLHLDADDVRLDALAKGIAAHGDVGQLLQNAFVALRNLYGTVDVREIEERGFDLLHHLVDNVLGLGGTRIRLLGGRRGAQAAFAGKRKFLGHGNFLHGHGFFVEIEVARQVDHAETQHRVFKRAGLGDLFFERGVPLAGRCPRRKASPS
jgi:hypothetical protein